MTPNNDFYLFIAIVVFLLSVFFVGRWVIDAITHCDDWRDGDEEDEDDTWDEEDSR